MELAVVILVLILLVAGGMGALIVLGGDSLPGGVWSNRRLPRPSARPRSQRVIDVPAEATKPVISRVEVPGREEADSRLEALTAELRTSLASGDDRLLRLNQQLDGLQQALHSRLEQIGRESNTRWSELTARQEAASERLRADVAGQRAESERRWSELSRQLGERERAEVTAELYALLARLEAAVAAVTNPVLLPGEPYAPPTEFLPESLVWENWKEVGDRTFAFADLYSARRLYLKESTRDEVGDFVMELRGLLTESIYPCLRQNAGPAQRETLHQALETLAARFTAVRTSLEADFRTIAETKDRSDSAGDGPGTAR